ncbi:hypothetical protein [Actinomadura sp. 6N118]|uniref:hypothetical protein n=1 Tax=Actinomadura sp. 6N118 TaxID=3375151 RepID=UPI0037923AF0
MSHQQHELHRLEAGPRHSGTDHPGGTTVSIDTGMVDLVSALWREGYATLQSCQDLGSGIFGGGCLFPPERRARYAAFWNGFAWLKMPADDLERLMLLAEPIVPGNGWEANIPILPPEGIASFGNLRYPTRQTPELIELIDGD